MCPDHYDLPRQPGTAAFYLQIAARRTGDQVFLSVYVVARFRKLPLDEVSRFRQRFRSGEDISLTDLDRQARHNST
jgi:hypothetical protein